jgi:hypothetical protein
MKMLITWNDYFGHRLLFSLVIQLQGQMGRRGRQEGNNTGQDARIQETCICYHKRKNQAWQASIEYNLPVMYA